MVMSPSPMAVAIIPPTASAREPRRSAQIPAGDSALGDAVDEAGEADQEGQRSGGVERAILRAPGQLAQDHRAPEAADEREGHVEPEHPRPADGDEAATEHRADDQADGADH